MSGSAAMRTVFEYLNAPIHAGERCLCGSGFSRDADVKPAKVARQDPGEHCSLRLAAHRG
jgi:hypothetical protein